MVRTIGFITAATLAALVTGSAVAAEGAPASLTEAALVGNWVVNEGKCTDTNAEFLVFNKNGSVVSVRDGQTDAAGFWKLDNNKIFLNVLATPARLHEELKDVEGYYPFDITIATFGVTADGFQGVGILGEQVRYGKFARCKT